MRLLNSTIVSNLWWFQEVIGWSHSQCLCHIEYWSQLTTNGDPSVCYSVHSLLFTYTDLNNNINSNKLRWCIWDYHRGITIVRVGQFVAVLTCKVYNIRSAECELSDMCHIWYLLVCESLTDNSALWWQVFSVDLGHRELIDTLAKDARLLQSKAALNGLEDMRLLFKYCDLMGILDKVRL